MIKVKNLNGTSNQNPGYPYSGLSWLEYWEKMTGRTAGRCSNIYCIKKAEHGSHVIKCDSFDSKAYIVPLCVECNNPNNKNEFFVSSELVAV